VIHGRGTLTISKGRWLRARQGEARKKVDDYRRQRGAAQVDADEAAQIAAARIIHCRPDPILINDHLHAKATRRYEWDGKAADIVDPEPHRPTGEWAMLKGKPVERTPEEIDCNRIVLQHLPLALAVANARRPGRGWIAVPQDNDDDDLVQEVAATAAEYAASTTGWQQRLWAETPPDAEEIEVAGDDDDGKVVDNDDADAGKVVTAAEFCGPLKIAVVRDDPEKGQKSVYYIDLAQQDDYFQVAVETLLWSWRPDTITTTFGSYAKAAAYREVHNYALREKSVVRGVDADTSLDAGLDADDDGNGSEIASLHEVATDDLYAGAGENPIDTAMAAALYAAERGRAVAAAADEHLTTKQQQVVQCAVTGLNQEETGQRLGIDQRTVSDLLARAAIRLRNAPGLRDYQNLTEENTVNMPKFPTVRIEAHRTPPSGVDIAGPR
jgi:RNA polymerase sigma factor (sigma-70 family)